MSKKGDKTKQLIKENAYSLFARKGFKEVTMKDICESTGLSRGGLYRHYESTQQIFAEIITSFLTTQDNDFSTKIEKGISAAQILDEILDKYKGEMIDGKNSLSLAIYEYFSNENVREEENLLYKQYITSFNSWDRLIQYGISRGEFASVDSKSVFDLMVFSYQGVRMYSKLINIQEEIPERIINQIKGLLLKK